MRTTKKLRTKRIAERILDPGIGEPLKLGGWFVGRESYIRLTNKRGVFLSYFDGYSLYRLAKGIVRHWEKDRP